MKYALITGANSGVGLGLAERIFNLHATNTAEDLTLIFACRNLHKASSALETLWARYPNARHSLTTATLQVDLCSPHESIPRACKEYTSRWSQLDLFYANAGVLMVEGVDFYRGIRNLISDPIKFFVDVSGTLRQRRGAVIDGSSMGTVFCANVYGHYVMLRMLEGFMSKCAGRMIITGSQTSQPEFFDWKDVQAIDSQFPYESSKFAVEMLAVGLNADFKQRQVDVQVFVADPGVVSTGILGGIVSWILETLFVVPIIYLAHVFMACVTFSPWKGAASLFYLGGFSGDLELRDVQGQELLPKYRYDYKHSSAYNWWQSSCYVECSPLMSNQVAEKCPQDKKFTDANGKRMLNYLTELDLSVLHE